MDYVEKNLRNGEEVMVKAKVSFLTVLPRLIWLAVFIAIAVIVATVILPELTEEEFIKKYGGNSLEAIMTIPQRYKTYQHDTAIVRTVLWIACPILGALPLLRQILVIFTTHLVITNKRLIGKKGVLKIETLDVPIDKVDNVSFSGGIFGNLLRYYNIEIKSAGSTGWKYGGVSNAQAFKDCANDAIEKHAEQARIDQAEQIASAMNRK